MAAPSKPALARAILARYPKTYGEELGIRSLTTPSSLYKLLVMATLMSARISATLAFDGTRALLRAGWTSPKKMAAAPWEQRTRALNQSGYARYDERTSTMLGEGADLLLERYRGDLRKLRDAAGADPKLERKLLKEIKGMGDVGVDIFFREVQRSWEEVAPFVDARAAKAAQRLGVGDTKALGRLAKGDDFARLVNGLVRVDLDKAYDEITAQASSRGRVASKR